LAATGRWLIYAASPANVTKNGLTSNFRHYNATYANYASPIEAGNGFIYASLAPTGSISVDTVLASGSAGNVYGATPTATYGYSIATSGIDLEDITGVATFTPVITSVSNAGNYTISYQGGLSASTNALSGPSTSFPIAFGSLIAGAGLPYTVTPAQITVVPIAASLTGTASKAYDGSTNATLSPANFSLSGFVSTDSASVTQTTGAYASKDAGTGIVVSAALSARDFSPVGSTNLSNYSLPTSASGSIGIITPAPVAVSGITASSKTYDGTTVAAVTGGTLLGVVSGDSLSFSLAGGNFNDKNVGKAKPVTVTGLTLSGADAANYTLGSSASVSADITPRALTLSGVTAADKVYDGSTVATLSSGVLSGAVSGDSVVLGTPSGAFVDKNVGLGKTVTVTGLTLAGADAANYSLGALSTSVSADITPRPLSASAVTAANKVYDGSTAATLSGGVLTGAVPGDSVILGVPTGAFSDKNVGVAKTVSISGLTLSGSDASNYTLGSTTSSTTADISKAAITGVSGLVVNDKVYDGKTTATVATTGANLAGLLTGDQVAVGSVESAFVDRNVGRDKAVNLSNLTLSGPDAANYVVTGTMAPVTGNITVRPLSTWTASGSGQWSSAANWDALPDASNVLAVAIPAGISVAYDAVVGSTQLQAISGNFSVAGGSLSVGSSLSTSQYGQSGGALSVGGAFTVNGSFSQTAGTIVASGPVAISHSAGDLIVAAINAPAISLAAPSGGISQSTALVTSGLLSTRSQGGTLLNDAGNRIGSFSASSTGVGDISLTSVGAIDVQGITAAAGNVTVFNTGGISTSGPVLANGGAVRMTANSPLTVGTGGITATGNIDLLASNLTSAGNLTLNGDLLSSAGAISLTAANNFAQNGSVSAALGLTVSAGGSVTLGPLARSFGNPVNYGINSVSVAAPPGSQSTTGSAPTDFVATFLSQFERAIVVSVVFGRDSLLLTGIDRRGIAVEGDLCSR
jgi:formylmethanofuran dehydrogenase subunit C